jgi:hypothetical protein
MYDISCCLKDAKCWWWEGFKEGVACALFVPDRPKIAG